ncbi:MAG: DegV family protein [Anaerolineales bacterium]
MTRVRIVTDSSARLPDPSMWDHPLLTAAPFHLHANGEAVAEDATKPLFVYHRFFDGADPPVAKAPSTEDFARIYGALFEESDQILSIHTATAAADSYANALSASERYLGRCDIQVVDSQTLSAGLGLLVELAVRAAEDDQPLDEIVRLVRGMIPRLYMVFFLDDLMHLERQGLITRSQGILGNMLGVIAFLTMEDGHLIPMEKVRSRPRALEKLVEFVAEFTHLDHIAILQPTPDSTEDAAWVAERVDGLHPGTPLTFTDYGPTTAALVGSNSLGVVVVESDEDLP